MGSRNAAAVFVYWPNLDDRAKVLALYLALVSLDAARAGQPARRFYGGRRAMAEALFGSLPDEDATDTYSVTRLRTAYRQTSRTIERLVGVGMLKVVRREGPGRAREYELLLERMTLTAP